MDRFRRDSDSKEEYYLWGNPCDYQNQLDGSDVPYVPELAKDIATSARHEVVIATEYQDLFANLTHSYDFFKELLLAWERDEWLRKYNWFTEEILPRDKAPFKSVPEEYVKQLMETIDSSLPGMYKALKMIVAALDAMQRDGMTDAPLAGLRERIKNTMRGVRNVLCKFNELMRARKLDVLKIDSEEIPDFKGSNKHELLLLVYRDTINYLEYITQVFQTLYEHGIANGQ